MINGANMSPKLMAFSLPMLQFMAIQNNTREFKNVISGLSRVKRAMLGKIGDGQRPCATYKGWSVIPTDYDLEKLNKDLTDDSSR